MSGSEFGIMVDLDGVLFDTGPHLLSWLQEDYGISRDLGAEDIIDFRMERCIPGCNFNMIKEIFENPEFWITLPLIPGANEFMKILNFIGQTHIMTDRFWYDGIHSDTVSSLKAAGIDYTSIGFVESKNKPFCVNELGLKLAFEDRMDNAEAISTYCPVGLIGQPSNFELSHSGSFYRIAKGDIYPDLQSAGVFALFIKDITERFTSPPPTCPKPSQQAFDTILDEAKHLVHGARQEEYGHPAVDLTRTAGMWTSYLAGQGDRPLKGQDVSWMMMMVKASRAKTDINFDRPIKRDHWADAAGYAETGYMVDKYDKEKQ